MIEGRDRDQSVSGLATRAARTQRWRVFGRAAKRVLPRASQGAIIPVESSSSSRQIQHRNPPVVELVSPVSSGIESAVKRERSAIARSREGALAQPSSARPTFEAWCWIKQCCLCPPAPEARRRGGAWTGEPLRGSSGRAPSGASSPRARRSAFVAERALRRHICVVRAI